jgi:hypothetical protein
VTIRTLALIAMAGTGCFNPHYDRPRCGPGDSCPGGLTCVNDACVSTGLFGDAGGSGGDSGGGDGSAGSCTSFASLVDTCQLTFDADLTVPTGMATYDTDTHVLKIGLVTTPVATQTLAIGSDQLDVISARNVHLLGSAVLRATGSHGLAIVASAGFTIETDAQIDVSAGGAGAQVACANGAMKGDNDNNGAGGGGGGGFGADGGTGGNGNQGSAHGGAKGSATTFPTGFHGGCPGADGGTGDAPGGKGGKGGGALYIVAAGQLLLNNSAPLKTSGGGGKGGPRNGGNGDAGGGGGGSGGLLVVEAPHITGADAGVAMTVITANGGGGGGGSSSQGPGTDGADGSVTASRALGGDPGATASGGGAGGSILGPVGDSVTAAVDGGGGGGGGGVGFLRILTQEVQRVDASPQSG